MSAATTPGGGFDDTSRWGAHRLPAGPRALLRLVHSIPVFPGGRRVALWLRHPLKHALAGPVDVRVWGLRLRLMPRGNLSESRWLFIPRFTDRFERRMLRGALSEGGVFLDLGANAGFYSFWAAACVGSGGRVYAVEPDPELQRRIRFNSATNGVASLVLLPVGVSDANGVLSLRHGDGNRGENRLQAADGNVGEAGAPTVEVLTLVDLCARHGITRIDAMKIDIEGHDYRVLRHFFEHAGAVLHPRFLQCEHVGREDNDSVEGLLRRQGYRVVGRGRLNTMYAKSDTGSSA